MDLEMFIECSKNLTDDQLKEIRSFINKELLRRANAGKKYHGIRTYHSKRNFYFLDQDLYEKFVSDYQEPLQKTTSYCELRRDAIRKFYAEPENWYGRVTLDITKTEFEAIRNKYNLRQFKRIESSYICGKEYIYNNALRCTYIVEEVKE